MKIADAKIRVPAATPQTVKTQRTYGREFKSEVIAQCLVPGVDSFPKLGSVVLMIQHQPLHTLFAVGDYTLMRPISA